MIQTKCEMNFYTSNSEYFITFFVQNNGHMEHDDLDNRAKPVVKVIMTDFYKNEKIIQKVVNKFLIYNIGI